MTGQMYVDPTPEPYFIYWLFKNKCVMCKKPATVINEIVPRSRWNLATSEWKNRIPLCDSCHTGQDSFHSTGVTDEKISEMKRKRREFLVSMGRSEYV